MKLENSKTYLVSHVRKGTFAMRIDSQCDTWANGVIVGGQAVSLLDYNVKNLGDEISVRKSFLSSAVEQPQAI